MRYIPLGLRKGHFPAFLICGDQTTDHTSETQSFCRLVRLPYKRTSLNVPVTSAPTALWRQGGEPRCEHNFSTFQFKGPKSIQCILTTVSLMCSTNSLSVGLRHVSSLSIAMLVITSKSNLSLPKVTSCLFVFICSCIFLRIKVWRSDTELLNKTSVWL